MALKRSRTTHVVTLSAIDIQQYADVPTRSRIIAVEPVRFTHDGPIQAVRITIETVPQDRHRGSDGRWRR